MNMKIVTFFSRADARLWVANHPGWKVLDRGAQFATRWGVERRT